MPVAYSAVGSSSESTSNPLPGSITPSAGDTVLLFGNLNSDSPTGSTYGASNLYMKRLGRLITNSASLAVYAINNVASGNATANFGKTGSGWVQTYPIAYSGVGGFGIPQIVVGSGTSPSQAIVVPNGALGVQGFTTGPNSPTISALTGGTNRVLDNANFARGTVGESASNATFGCTLSATAPWGGIYVPLLTSPLIAQPYLTDNNSINTGPNGGSGSLSLNTQAGDYVLMDFAQTGTGAPNTPTCDGANMSLVISLPYNGSSYRFDRYVIGPLGSGGPKTVAITTTAGQWWTMNACSIANSSGLGLTSTTSGQSTSPSHAATLQPNQIVIQGFASNAACNTSTGGPIIADNPAASLVFNYMSASDQSTTFGHSNSANWGSIHTIINPPLGKSNRFFAMY